MSDLIVVMSSKKAAGEKYAKAIGLTKGSYMVVTDYTSASKIKGLIVKQLILTPGYYYRMAHHWWYNESRNFAIIIDSHSLHGGELG